MSLLCYSEEAEEYIEIGALNGLFVLGRSMGFIGESALTNLLCCAVKLHVVTYILCFEDSCSH